MPIVWIAPYCTPTAGSGWVTEAGTGTLIRSYITMSTPTAATMCTTIPWGGDTFCTTSATTSTYTTWVAERVFDFDREAWPEPYDRLPRSPQRQLRGVAAPAIVTERDDAENRRMEEGAQRRAREIEERHARAAEVRDRAHALLLEHLTPEQRRTFEQNQWFIVDGKSGVKYRVRGNSFSGNVDVLNKHQMTTHRLCGHCSHDIPLHDQLLAQKFMIEHAEDDFIRIANRHPA